LTSIFRCWFTGSIPCAPRHIHPNTNKFPLLNPTAPLSYRLPHLSFPSPISHLASYSRPLFTYEIHSLLLLDANISCRTWGFNSLHCSRAFTLFRFRRYINSTVPRLSKRGDERYHPALDAFLHRPHEYICQQLRLHRRYISLLD
jgi:hypothetical protein